MGVPGTLEWIGIFYNESSSKFVGVRSLISCALSFFLYFILFYLLQGRFVAC